MSTRKVSLRAWALACVLVCVVTTAALAGMVEVGYRQLRGDAPAAVAAQTAASSSQSAVWSTTPINPIRCNGNQKVAGFVTFSNSGATCSLTVGLYHLSASGTYTFLGHSKIQTITASTTQTITGGAYVGTTDLDADTRAANVYDLRINAISAGSVTVVHYPFGSGIRPGE